MELPFNSSLTKVTTPQEVRLEDSVCLKNDIYFCLTVGACYHKLKSIKI